MSKPGRPRLQADHVLSPAERKRRQRERRKGFCPKCVVTCLRCGQRSVDARGKFTEQHDCPTPRKRIRKATCDGCLTYTAERAAAGKAT